MTGWPSVLVVHNQFQHLGGEDFSAYAEIELMRAHDAQVTTLLRDSNDVPRIRQVKRQPWSLVFNRETYDEVRRIVRAHQVEIVHCHNLLPLLSTSVYWAACAEGAAIVQTVHDFRMGCLQGQLLRNGRPCEQCAPGHHAPGVAFACYRHSRVESVALGVAQTVNYVRGAWSQPTLFIAPSDFVRQRLLGWGFPHDRILVKPHFVSTDPGTVIGDRPYSLYVGRLSTEKGLDQLLDVWTAADGPLLLAGDGPLRDHLERRILDASHADIRVLGHQSPAELSHLFGQARLLVLPSLTYETFGRVLIEAYAHAVPVLATRLGATPEIVEDGVTGLLVDPHRPGELRARLDELNARPTRLRGMGVAARRAYERRYSADVNADLLRGAYAHALALRGAARHPEPTEGERVGVA